MYRRLLLSSAVLLVAATFARADIKSFNVTVDTSTLAGTMGGYIDLQFNPNLGPAGSGAATITAFSPGDFGLGGEIPPLGDVTGSLAALPVVIANTFGTNDYDESVTVWGHAFSFTVSLDTAATNSTFLVSLLDDSFMPLLAPRPEGAVAELAIGASGAITPDLSTYASAAAVPEPGAWMLLGTVLLMLVMPRALIRRRGRC